MKKTFQWRVLQYERYYHDYDWNFCIQISSRDVYLAFYKWYVEIEWYWGVP